MKTILSRAALLMAAFALTLVVGCGPKVTRDADISSGDYYSTEEFEKLSKEQRDAYCAALDAELASLEKAKSDADGQASGVKSQLSKLQSEIKTLEGQYEAAGAEASALQEEIDWYEGLPTSYTVVKGDFLQKISAQETIYADATKWTRIYFANRDMLLEQGPNWIYPGWELKIPRDWPNNWTVRQDEYLGRIAGYWEVYDDATQWTRLYEANKDVVQDPDMIWPGWELRIPRD